MSNRRGRNMEPHGTVIINYNQELKINKSFTFRLCQVLTVSARNVDAEELRSRFFPISTDWVKWPSASLICFFFMSTFVKVKSVSRISLLSLLIYLRKTSRGDGGTLKLWIFILSCSRSKIQLNPVWADLPEGCRKIQA